MIQKANQRVRLKVIRDGAKKVKELRLKEKKDALKIEIEMEKSKRVQQSPSRANPMTGVSFNTTSDTLNSSRK